MIKNYKKAQNVTAICNTVANKRLMLQKAINLMIYYTQWWNKHFNLFFISYFMSALSLLTLTFNMLAGCTLQLWHIIGLPWHTPVKEMVPVCWYIKVKVFIHLLIKQVFLVCVYCSTGFIPTSFINIFCTTSWMNAQNPHLWVICISKSRLIFIWLQFYLAFKLNQVLMCIFFIYLLSQCALF